MPILPGLRTRRLATLAALAALAVLPASAAVEIAFVSPRPNATVIGRSTLELTIRATANLTVRTVTITVDGRALAVLTGPPWKAEWDAGDGSAGHRLAARAVMSDGSEAVAEISTSRLQIDAVEEVALVNVYAIARDGGGRYVTDLDRDDFRILENGKPQDLRAFSADRKPLRIALVLDTSHSMRGTNLKAAKAAVSGVLDALEKGDEGIVITFDDKARVSQDLTSDREALRAAVEAAEAKGGTALYDSLWAASEKLREFDGRRVIVLLSDGRDEAASGLEPGSFHTLEEAVDRALRNDVMIFVVGLGMKLADDAARLERNPSASAYELDFFRRTALATILREIAETTGGRAVFSAGSAQLKKSFAEVTADLRNQYSLAYRSDDARHDGSWRQIVVKAARPGVTVDHRKGYYAPRDGTATSPR